jgi:ATP-dependent RNA helicase DDX46/PRP5
LLTAGYPCLSLHGGKDQVDRDHTLHEFKTGVKTVLIATSVAGRGLDVPDIVCVVNFSTPNHIEEYVHRVGRTGRAGRKGTAYTFVSTQEDKYCSVCIRALERAGVEVPKEVRELQAAFQAKVERGEAKAVHSNSGFVGKGFTFDSDEMNEAQRAQAMQKKAYEKEQGLAADDDDDDQPSGAGDGDGGSGRQALAPQLLAKLERARQIAALLSASKNLLVQSSAANIAPASASVTAAGAGAVAAGAATASMLHLLAPCFLPDGTVDAKAAQGRARQIWAEVLRARSGGAASGVDAGPSGVAHFSEEIDINDYPAPARKRITQKATLDDVVERTGVAIIQRGNYVAPNKKLEPGEKRLRLIIEASTEIAVQKARAEIMRVLEDETLRTSGSGSGGGQPTGGRYSVL